VPMLRFLPAWPQRWITRTTSSLSPECRRTLSAAALSASTMVDLRATPLKPEGPDSVSGPRVGKAGLA
jgi:hypothetical protein